MIEHQTPCPHCYGVHYSIYNAERCATRHRIANEVATYEETEAAKNKPLEGAELLAAYHKWRNSPNRGRPPKNIRHAF